MPYTTLTLGLTLTVPTGGTTNWASTMLNTTWTKISSHDHSGSGNGAPLSSAGIANYSITTVKLSKNYGVTQASTLTPAGTTQTIDFDNGNTQTLDLGSASGNVTLTLSNGSSGAFYRIWVIQGATPRSLTWPASVIWPQGVAVSLTSTNDAKDLITLYYDGTNYLGEWQLDWR